MCVCDEYDVWGEYNVCDGYDMCVMSMTCLTIRTFCFVKRVAAAMTSTCTVIGLLLMYM